MTSTLNANPKIEDSIKRVRVLFGGAFIVDTTKSKLIWDKPYYPAYYFAQTDVPQKYLREDAGASGTGAKVYDVVVGDKRAAGAATAYADGARAGLVCIAFGSMDAWFEEDEEIFVHPKDPYKRVDVLQSSRHVRVEVNGVEVANTTKPRLLFETSLPVRTYIPKTDCRLDFLVPTDTTTQCPYKGVASYYSVRTPNGELAKDVVWWYRVPLPECESIRGFVAFYDEFVDVWVDGVKQARPSRNH